MSIRDETGSGAGKFLLLLTVSLLVLCLAVAVAMTVGDYAIALGTVVLAVGNGLGLTTAEIPRIEQSVVWDLRLSRALVAALAGAGLAICGAILQALLRNPLAEPFVLGVSAGASTGAVAVIVLGIGRAGCRCPWGLSRAPSLPSRWWRFCRTARPAGRTTRSSRGSPPRSFSTR